MKSGCAHPGKPVAAGWLALALFVTPAAAAQQKAEPPPEGSGGIWSSILKLYEQAKAAGDKVPESVSAWVLEDLDRIGGWEYRVISPAQTAPADLEKELNKLGGDRWEVFWVDRQGGRLQVMLKRPSRSYLKSIPLTDLLNVLPLGDASAGPK